MYIPIMVKAYHILKCLESISTISVSLTAEIHARISLKAHDI